MSSIETKFDKLWRHYSLHPHEGSTLIKYHSILRAHNKTKN